MAVDRRMIGKSTDVLQAKAGNHEITYWCDNKTGLIARFSGELFLGVLLKIVGKVSATIYLHAADYMLQEKKNNEWHIGARKRRLLLKCLYSTIY